MIVLLIWDSMQVSRRYLWFIIGVFVCDVTDFGGPAFSGGFPVSAGVPLHAFAAGPPGGVSYNRAPAYPMSASFQPSSLPTFSSYDAMPVFPTSLRTTTYSRPMFSTTVKHITTTPRNDLTDLIAELVWLSSHTVARNKIEIDNKQYELGNNQTHVQTTPCQVAQLKLTGTCTLLSACPKVYPRLDSFQTYKEKFFCPLEGDR